MGRVFQEGAAFSPMQALIVLVLLGCFMCVLAMLFVLDAWGRPRWLARLSWMQWAVPLVTADDGVLRRFPSTGTRLIF